jgi:hypothetical protein
VVAVLAVVVAVLSYQLVHHSSSASQNDVSGIEARLDEIAGQVQAIQSTATAAEREARAAEAAAAKHPKPAATPQQPGLARCLVEVQREIDDLEGYLAYSTPPRRDRVSGACATLLHPRFHS